MDFTADERRDWLTSDVTRAFLRELETMAAAAVSSMRVCIGNGDLPGAAEFEGRASGYEMATQIAGRTR
jgi:hypothetical protein